MAAGGEERHAYIGRRGRTREGFVHTCVYLVGREEQYHQQTLSKKKEASIYAGCMMTVMDIQFTDKIDLITILLH